MKNKLGKYISLLLKIIVIIFAISGIVISMNADEESFMGGTTMLMYFTIQSNIFIALICLIGIFLMLSKRKIPNWWFIIKFVGTVSITLTGIVFWFVLAPTSWDFAWNKVNIYTHVIVPITAIIDFFVVGVESNIRRKDIIYTIIPPLLYLGYSVVGYINNWEFSPETNYPYFFLNWGSSAGAFGFSKELPFIGCMWWILILICLILSVSLIYLKIINLIKHKNKQSEN